MFMKILLLARSISEHGASSLLVCVYHRPTKVASGTQVFGLSSRCVLVFVAQSLARFVSVATIVLLQTRFICCSLVLGGAAAVHGKGVSNVMMRLFGLRGFASCRWFFDFGCRIPRARSLLGVFVLRVKHSSVVAPLGLWRLSSKRVGLRQL